MTIKVFPSLLEGAPIETHQWQGTLAAWFAAQGIDYATHAAQPVVVARNGVALPVEDWPMVVLTTSDDVEIRVLPGGGIFKAIGSIFNVLLGWLLPHPASQDYSNNTPQAKQLQTAQSKANQAKLGDVVPELAGRFRRYPDYLTPPRRYFANLREQWLQFHACIGPGQYQIAAADVKVGDTPFSDLGADGGYQIFGPGADLSGVDTNSHWHTVSEVGGTSSGTAGLELSTELANRTNTDPAGGYTFSGGTITRTSGTFPTGWGAGTTVYVEYPQSYSVQTIHVPEAGSVPAYDISEITGYFGHLGTLAAGNAISLGAHGSEVAYKVRSVTGGNVVRLETQSGDPVVISAGTQTLIFGTNIVRTISTLVVEGEITVSPGGFQSGTVAAARVIFAGGTVYGEWTSEFVATPGQETTANLEIDFFFPRGLVTLSDEGDVLGRSVGVQIQYRSADGAGAATAVSRTYSQATVDQIGFTESLAIPRMRPSVRVRRVGASSTSTSVQDTVNWYGLKSLLRTRVSYPNWTTMSVRLRSGGRLAAQSENQINVVATRILPVLQNGAWGPAAPTRDISAFARYIAQTIGYTDDDLDMAELARLHAVWTSRGETMDHVFDLTTVKDALNVTFGAGMAELTISDGQIRPARDDVRTQFEQPYSPQNMTGPLQRSFQARRIDDADGVEVEYTDSTTWTQQTVVCALPGSQRLKLEKLTIAGVTDRTRAWRIGMRRARQIRYRNWTYQFSTELDALNSEYLSYVPLSDDIPGYGQSALLESIESAAGGALLRVTEPLRWEPGKDHVVAYRNPDGTLAGPWAATPGPDGYSLIADIPQPWPAITLSQELPHVYFGTTERWCFPALITEIQPSDNGASVTAVNYDARVYADDNNAPD